jgi:simple sugar transport system permease protein
MRKLFARQETYLIIVIVLLSAIITGYNSNFLSLQNLFDLLKSYSLMGIFAVGVLFVLISGGIDISFTAIATVAVYTTVVFTLRFGGNIVTAFLMASAIGVLLGLINALIIYYFNIPSIVTTIATLNIYYGVLTVLSGGKWIYKIPDFFRSFADQRLFTLTNGEGIRYGLSVIPLIWFAVILVAALILRYTILGRGIYAMGGSPASARRAGFNTLSLTLFVYGFMGLMAGIASVIQVLLVQAMQPNAMVGKELDVIAAVVLGGASLSGGTGTLLGTVLGVALIALLNNGLTIMRVPSIWYNVIIGLIILISVAASAQRSRRKARRAILAEADEAAGRPAHAA